PQGKGSRGRDRHEATQETRALEGPVNRPFTPEPIPRTAARDPAARHPDLVRRREPSAAPDPEAAGADPDPAAAALVPESFSYGPDSIEAHPRSPCAPQRRSAWRRLLSPPGASAPADLPHYPGR